MNLNGHVLKSQSRTGQLTLGQTLLQQFLSKKSSEILGDGVVDANISTAKPTGVALDSDSINNSSEESPAKQLEARQRRQEIPGNGVVSANISVAKRTREILDSEANNNPSEEAPAFIQLESRKRRRRNSVVQYDVNELPHNLGPSLTTIAKKGSSNLTEKHQKPCDTELVVEERKDHISASARTRKGTAVTGLDKVRSPSTKQAKKATKIPYGLTPGRTPYPEWSHPTLEECDEVNRLLTEMHGEVVPPTTLPEPSLTVSGCGEVPSILDALIRTLVSGATTKNNSALAFQGLVNKFGILKKGIGKGSVDWDKVRQAPVEEIRDAIKSGGLAQIKSQNIKQILQMVYDENMARRNSLIKARKEGGNGPQGAERETEQEKDQEIRQAEEHVLSLNHLHVLPKEEAMLEFVKYPGIGVKTAACVVLFCLQRPCFAVDTHVFRISKWLGWVPPEEKVNEITAFSHLEVRIPDPLKYSLHQLFIFHGKACPRCRAITGENSEGWEKGCVIDHLVKRTGARKGNPDTEKKNKKKPAKGRSKTIGQTAGLIK